MVVHTDFRHWPFSRTIQWLYMPKGTKRIKSEWLKGNKVIFMALFLSRSHVISLSRQGCTNYKILIITSSQLLHQWCFRGKTSFPCSIKYSRHGFFNKIQGEFQGLFKEKTFLSLSRALQGMCKPCKLPLAGKLNWIVATWMRHSSCWAHFRQSVKCSYDLKFKNYLAI